MAWRLKVWHSRNAREYAGSTEVEMVWNQDLAKLKQQLKEDGDPAPLPVQKPVSPAKPMRSMGEEDATFLAAMGLPAPMKASPVNQPKPGEASEPGAAAGGVAEFLEAVGGPSGLRPMARNPVLSAPPPGSNPPSGDEANPVPSQGTGDQQPLADGPPAGASSSTAPAPAPKEPPGPRLIHLAAGMAVEVEAILDLRGHSVQDAKERLKERLQDSVVLGWRTLHVILGPSEALRQAFLAFLLTPPARILAQYAQAPIPMGGNHAFIVYFVGPSA